MPTDENMHETARRAGRALTRSGTQSGTQSGTRRRPRSQELTLLWSRRSVGRSSVSLRETRVPNAPQCLYGTSWRSRAGSRSTCDALHVTLYL
ncbi:hypothetical protein EYF80_065789 [Liparis tanakae]|uniref:Uncharacterized protein n=1 Tax=Liparis tanakae TaxID=230148 RepID=A0A4Z2E5T5_9TELE|nr:hypothetical protein EYF80_065789 [Liparis tanakae]